MNIFVAPQWPALRAHWIAVLALSIFSAGCGGSQPTTSTASTTPTTSSAECDADNSTPGTEDDCGEVYIGLTDAAGDFVTYSVIVTSLTLQRADGSVVETLPSDARIDFAQYTEMTEFLSAASVPPGTYVSGSIGLDYRDAEIYVETENDMAEAVVVDADGQPLSSIRMDLVLDNRKQLVVRPGIPALLTVDFDLSASHEVDLNASPITATAEPFLLAEVDPVDSKELRLRGALISVKIEESSYAIGIRPLHVRDGLFGRTRVHTDSTTVFEIDGTTFEGSAGLAAMSELQAGTPTVAFGKLNVITRTYLAAKVYAGSSVPGYDLDVVRGNVISREGNTLRVRGAVLIPRQGRAVFHRNVTVLISDNTKVLKAGHHDQALDTSAISVGQRINAFGEVSADPDTGIVLNASEGRVRLLMTHLNGSVNRVLPGQLDVDLQSINGRPIRIFDFTGTGTAASVDADPDNYEINTRSLDLSGTDHGAPVRVFGFVEAFGAAPPDFNARTVVDYSDSRALLAIGWGRTGTATPFVTLGGEGIVLDLENPEIGARHYIRQGSVFSNLLELATPPLIAPHPEQPGVFAIKQNNTIWIHSDFVLFSQDLASRLDGNTQVRGMYAKGGYQADASLFIAARIGVLLN